MIKQILLIALCLVATQQAALGACDGTTGFTIMGVCQYKADAECKTFTATAGCTACFTDATQDATTKECTCPAAKVNGILASTSCVAAAPSPTCQDGYFDSSNTCTACHESCKTCTAAGSDKCSACWADGTATSGVCAGPSGKLKLIPRNGYLAACPDGYVVDATDDKICRQCLYGCKTCTATDRLTKCATCATDFEVRTSDNRCHRICDTTKNCDLCDADKTKCETCAAGHVLTAAGVCTRNSIPLCKVYETDPATCKECETDAELAADKKSCKCKAHLRNTVVAYVAPNATATPAVTEVFYSNKCEACGSTPACADGSTCTQNADKTKDTCAAATPKDVTVTCADETLKKANCATCADKKCSACINTTWKLDEAAGCGKCNDKYVLNTKVTPNTCVSVGTFDCTTCKDGKVCGLDADSKVACVDAPATTSDAATNGILVSALSIIAALILA